VLRACHEQGIEVADFLAPAMPYKLTWTSEAVAIEDYALPFTWKGRLTLVGWQGIIRPLAKRLFMRLPGSLRKLAAPRVSNRAHERSS
jgi:CelD/BcsL family acetyltransferase involved in cellulose biosynthesis